ncbi:hypothetical protein CEXT_784641 [Caerostris extrusa]|uniref:Uncharacterized protein n=1 Tax=Caerostris extrusa TaxID=172846 RepID=A0AAV4R0M1_CAEEX|nr:hypothetical protein CEXT_784641 [Caerostris extrusa]
MLRPLALVLVVFLTAACCSEELKAMFSNLECGGTYDKYKMFAAVGLCEECYNLWKEDTMRDLCTDVFSRKVNDNWIVVQENNDLSFGEAPWLRSSR